MRDRGWSISQLLLGVASNLAWFIVFAVSPFIIAAVIYGIHHIRKLPPLLLIGIPSVGWSLTIVGFVIWYSWHRDGRATREFVLANSLFLSDEEIPPLVNAARRRSLGARMMKSLCNQLLQEACTVLTYRLAHVNKGAMFMVLQDDGKFEVFAKHNHTDPGVDHEIRTSLTRQNGMAGQAVRQRRCVAMKDCRRPPADVEWVRTQPEHEPPRFLGRSAVPVFATVKGREKEVGALCFDTKKARLISRVDCALR